jgi:adenine-specific DNA-methyltransferase
MLDYIVAQTDKYILSKPKDERKSLGQFFTSKDTARFMAGLFSVPQKDFIRVLDPGAGSGILSAAVLEVINKDYPVVKEIELTCYETNDDVIPLLESNIAYMQRSSRIKLTSRIVRENYLLSQADDFTGTLHASAVQQKYEMVIGNPPYFKLQKEAPEAATMPEVCYGAPNIYFLFASMSLFNLREYGEMVYIVPRSWTSGAYFSRFRSYFLKHGKLTDIHIFTSRNKVFDKEDVLQETMIIKLQKTVATPSTVRITSSADSKSFNKLTELDVPYGIVVSGEEKYVYLVTSQDEVDVLQKVNTFEQPMPSIGLKMKTGLTVDFRNREFLRNTNGGRAVPLFYSQHIKDGRVAFPIGKENEYILDEMPSLVQLNRNYLFVKRFTAKEERRRLQCAVYFADQYPEYQKISTQNKINFIDTIDNTEMTTELVCGLYIILNSTLYDTYYRILNGSTQVNSTEMNSIPVPARSVLESLGKRLMEHEDYSTEYSDRILEEVVYA